MPDEATDAIVEASTVGTDAKGTESPEKAPERSIQEVVKDVVKGGEQNATEDVEEDAEVPAETEVAEEVEETVAEVQTDEEKDKLLPFHTHPRWKEITTELKSLRPLKQEVERLKPVVEQHEAIVNFRQSYGITDEMFRDALEVAALLNVDRKAAVEKLKGYLSTLEMESGDRIADDLQKKVADGLMSEEDAKELTKLRLQQKLSQERYVRQNEQAQRGFSQQVVATLNQWDMSTRSRDPDFKPKAEGKPDGKFELVRDRLQYLMSVQPPQSPQAVVALAEQALKEINATYAALRPKAQGKKTMAKNGTVTTGAKPEFKLDADMRNLKQLVHSIAKGT